MLTTFLRNIFGSQNERVLKRMRPLVEAINALEPTIAALSDEALRAKTDQFRQQLAEGIPLDTLLPEAFSVVREASKRTIGLRHFDVQLMGGIVLHQGKIAEMKTGEGKTLVATLPVYLNALTGNGVHVVTVNDYLAKRDAAWMGPIYHFLGLTVGVIQQSKDNQERLPAYLYDPSVTGRGDGMDGLRRVSRPEAYQANVTYVTNNEVGFDYLRDNMVVRKEDRSLRYLSEPREVDGMTRRLPYAIVDEVDSILIDEARTPLIISGPAEESTEKYHLVNRIVPHLKGRVITEKEEIEAKYKGIDLGEGYDFVVDEKAHTVTLTEAGGAKCEHLLGVKSLYDDIQGEWVHHVTQALRAHTLYKRDVDYVVKDGQVIIVDEFTGRLMPGRRWSEGLHQAVEAKEGLRIAEENQTLATITFQNFFRLYEKLAGMTGTALTEAAEFWEIYKLDVVEIPTNKPMIRVDYADVIYRTEREKDDAITGEIEELWKQGQPVLLGTRSIEKSEKLAALLRRKGIPHQVLNAKYHEREAQIIAQAGRKGTCTIATNMAGRGTDIVLSGSPPDPTEAEFIKQLGGLHVLGTERHESRRIDNQLRGRCGRQGDPGSSRFYLSLEDELMRLFGSDRLSGLMQRLGMKEGEDIQHPWVTKAIENAQRKVEAMNFDIRKQLLEYDNVMNKQREVVYALRNEILDGEAVNQQIKDMILESIEEKVATIAADKRHPEEWDVAGVLVWMRRTFDVSLQFTTEEIADLTPERLQERLRETAEQAYQERERKMGSEEFRHLERMILLQMIDIAWKEHLYDLDQLKKGIGLRAYGQKDPLVEYQHESFNLFTTMMRRIREQTVEYLFRIHMEPFTPRPVFVPTRAEKPEVSTAGLVAQGVMADARSGRSAVMEPMGAPSTGGPVPGGGKPTPVTVPKKIGRNDPCPCGSGKKYKKCCGR